MSCEHTFYDYFFGIIWNVRELSSAHLQGQAQRRTRAQTSQTMTLAAAAALPKGSWKRTMRLPWMGQP